MTGAAVVPAPDVTPTPELAGRSRPVPVRVAVLLGGVVALALVMALSVRFGSRRVGLDDIVPRSAGRDTIEQAASQAHPRTLLAVIVGGSLPSPAP